MSRLDEIAAVRRQATAVAKMRALARGAGSGRTGGERRPAGEPCEICSAPLPDDHRHLLHLD